MQNKRGGLRNAEKKFYFMMPQQATSGQSPEVRTHGGPAGTGDTAKAYRGQPFSSRENPPGKWLGKNGKNLSVMSCHHKTKSWLT